MHTHLWYLGVIELHPAVSVFDSLVVFNKELGGWKHLMGGEGNIIIIIIITIRVEASDGRVGSALQVS
jgi:hypothetical protein